MRRRIVGVATSVTAMVVIAFALPLALTVRSLATQAATAAVETEAADLAQQVGRSLAAGGDVADLVRTGDLGDGLAATVVTDDELFGAIPSDPDLLKQATAGSGVARSTPAGVGVALPIAGTDGSTLAVVAVESTDDGGRSTAIAWAVLAGLSVLLVGLSAVVADRLAADLVRSVDQLAVGAEALAAGDLEAQVDPGGPFEIATVATALNRLGSRISALLRAEREEVADLAHELRTPLTALRLETEGTSAERSVLDLSRAVDEVITEARRPLVDPEGAHCNLVRVVADRAQFWRALAADEQRPLEVRLPEEPVEVATDARSVASALDALVGNVFEHTPAGTPIRLSVDVLPAAVTVEDGGPGLPDESVLVRGIGGGTGLGLDIARRSVVATGGRLDTFTSDLGGAGIRLRYA
jgi:signal transduction histidine kinase